MTFHALRGSSGAEIAFTILLATSIGDTVTQCTAATFHSVYFSKPNSVWFGKFIPKKCEGFYKPIPVWFGNKKNDLQDTDSKPNSDWFGTI